MVLYEQKEGEEQIDMQCQKKKGHSIFYTIQKPLICLLLVECLFIIAVPIFSGLFQELNQNKEDILNKQVENRKNNLENTMNTIWADLRQLSASINITASDIMQNEQITMQELQNNPEKCNQFLLDISEDMITELYLKRVNGIYVMLNTEDLVETKRAGQEFQRYGLHITDLNPTSMPSERKSDLFLKHAPDAVAQALQIAKDPNWKENYIFDPKEDAKNYDFLYFPFQMAYYANKIDNPKEFGYWFFDHSKWSENDETTITYSQPLVLEDGTVYGVLGIEITNQYLYTLLPHKELTLEDDGGSYALVNMHQANGKTYLDHVVKDRNMPEQEILVPQSELKPVERKINNYKLEANGKTYYVAAHPLLLYGSRNYIDTPEWMLIGVVEEDNLYQFSKYVSYIIGIGVIWMLILGVLGNVFVSRRLSVPIRNLSDEVYDAQQKCKGIPNLSQTGINEIDHFSSAIMTLSQDVVQTSARFLRIIEMATGEVAGFEIRNDDSVFITENFFSLLNIKVKLDHTISVPEFQNYMEQFKKRVPYTERPDGSIVYEISTYNKQKRFIRVSIKQWDGITTGLAEDVTALVVERQMIEYDRDYDLLTGLLNRRAFYREVEKICQGKTINGYGAVLMMDLDNLKKTNDHFGHEWGDRYLQQGAFGLSSAAPQNTILARLGGDEFVMVFYGYSSQEEAYDAVQIFQKRAWASSFLAPNGVTYPVELSAGLALYPKDGTDFYDLMKFADFALYQVKRMNKGVLGLFDMETYKQEQLLVQNRKDLQKVLNEELLEYHFQPIFRAKDGSIYAYEALMRVDMPTIHTPNMMLRLAQQEHKLKEIERLTMLKSTEAYNHLLQQDLVNPEAYLFINSIGNQWIDEEEQEFIRKKYPDFALRIVAEITEITDIDSKALAQKRKMRCFSGLLALDDYGRGYKKEGKLLDVAPNFVKLDLGMVRGIDTDESKQQMVAHLVHYAHQRDMLIIAEGLESMEEIQKCLELRVDLLQGFALAKPQAIPENISAEAKRVIQQFWKYGKDETI